MSFEGFAQGVVTVVLVIVALVMTGVLAAAIYANRSALPVVGAVFGALIVFGLFW